MKDYKVNWDSVITKNKKMGGFFIVNEKNKKNAQSAAFKIVLQSIETEAKNNNTNPSIKQLYIDVEKLK